MDGGNVTCESKTNHCYADTCICFRVRRQCVEACRCHKGFHGCQNREGKLPEFCICPRDHCKHPTRCPCYEARRQCEANCSCARCQNVYGRKAPPPGFASGCHCV